MSLMIRPTSTLSSIFSNLLRPETTFDNDLFDLDNDFFPMRIGRNVPSVNIRETSKEYWLEVAAPGLKRNDFRIEVDHRNLTISAEKEVKKEEKEKENGYSRKEYSYNSFSRTFFLPQNVKEDNIDAKYEDGILKVHVPKAKETPSKPIQIAVS